MGAGASAQSLRPNTSFFFPTPGPAAAQLLDPALLSRGPAAAKSELKDVAQMLQTGADGTTFAALIREAAAEGDALTIDSPGRLTYPPAEIGCEAIVRFDHQGSQAAQHHRRERQGERPAQRAAMR